MAQTQTFQREWEGHQTQPNQKHKQIYETEPNQKAIKWLETQTQQKEWERAENCESIVVINHLDSSEHDILTMVEQVLTKNEFSDDSSIFVVVPSIDNDAGNSSNHRHSSVCMQMCEKPMTLKNKDKPVGRNPKQHRNSTTHEGVKLSSKGKMFFMEVLPADTPYHNKEVLCDRQNPKPKGDWKKGTKNKLCQITTPNSIVERVENQRNAVSVDTTVDRPCCCSAKTNQYSDNNPNNRQVANVMSNIITPQGMVNTPFYSGWRMTPRESVKSAKLPLAPGNIPLSKLYRTQHYIAAPPQQFARAPIQQLTCAPTQQSARAFLQKHTRAPIQQLTCAPTHLTWALDQQCAEACPTQNRDEACPTQLCGDACFTQNRDDACPTQLRGDACVTQNHDEACRTQIRGDACVTQNRDEACQRSRAEEYPTLQQTEARSTLQNTEASSTQQRSEPCPIQHPACPTCQCSPEQLLELFKLAVTGGKLYGIPTICGECPEPETLARVPPAEPAPGAEPGRANIPIGECVCGTPSEKIQIEMGGTKQTKAECVCGTPSERMQIEMGETKQKKGSLKQTKFSSTVGTSTDGTKPPRKRGWWSWRKNICECPPPPEPAPEEPKPKPDIDLEPHLTIESYFKEKDSLILSAELLKKNSLDTQRVSGFRLQQDKRLPPEPETDFTVEDAIRYLAMMNPDVFYDIMKEQQAKLDGTYKPPPPPPPAAEPPKPPVSKADEGFKGLKFKVGGKGSGSKGLAGVCCFDLLTESFTTW